MSDGLKMLMAAACVAVIAFVGYFFIDQARRDASQTAERQAAISQAMLDSRCSAQEQNIAYGFRMYGADAIWHGYPMAEAAAKKCGLLP